MSDSSQITQERLVGWKRISNHLGCSERTARRWEREEDLPVHRQQHASQSTVYAQMAELDAWLKSRSQLSSPVADAQSSGPPRLAIWIFALAAICLIGILGFDRIFAVGTPHNAGSQDPVAVDLFERGRALWLQRGKEPNERAVKLLTEAVSRDESYAEAWQALASAWMTLPTYSDEVGPQQAINEAIYAADQAIRLDPSLAEIRSVMASVAQARGDWIASQRIFDDALRQDPDNTMLMLWLAEQYRDLGYNEQNQSLLLEAIALDPNSPPLQTAFLMIQHVGPDPKTAQDDLLSLWNDAGLEVPTAWFGIWHTHVRLGEYEAAEAWIDASPVPINAELLSTFLQAMRSEDAEVKDVAMAATLAAYDRGFPGWLAYTLLDHLGATDAALEIAEREAATGRFDLSVVMFDPLFPATRNSDRFKRIVDQLGYVDYWKQNGAPDFCAETPAPPICVGLPN